MTANVYENLAMKAWSASARYTASGATDILLANLTRYTLTWTTTMSDDAPAIPYHLGNRIGGNANEKMQLADGERLWVAVIDVNGASFNVEV